MSYFAIMVPGALAGTGFVCLMLALYLAWPWISGVLGVALVQRRLAAFEKENCVVMHNLILPTKRGDTIQIDHIMFSPYGIFTIKAVAHAGEINGSLRDAMWIQTHHGQKYRFANPTRNSQMQREVVSAILGRKAPVHDIVVFEAGKLSGTMPDNVTRAKHLGTWIKSHGGKHLSMGQVRRMSAVVQSVMIKDEESKRLHEQTFMTEQGLESRLRLAKVMTFGSTVLVVIAMSAAVTFFLKGGHHLSG